MIKIAFITQPWDGIGPGSSLGILTCNIIKRLIKNNKVIVFAKNGKCNLEDNGNIEYFYFFHKTDAVIEKFLVFIKKLMNYKKYNNPVFNSFFYYFFYSLSISLKLKKINADIVHIHNFSQFVPVIRFFNKNIKIILHMHCEWLSQLDKNIIRRRIKKTDKIIGCSKYISDKIKEVFPEFSYKIQSLPNGTNIPEIISGDNTKAISIKKILFVGRISPEKGVHTLLSAFNKVAKERPDVHLDLAGAIKTAPKEYIISLDSNQYVKNLDKFYNQESYFDKLNAILYNFAKEKVVFHQHLDYEKLKDLYEQADLLVNPSLSESFGMAVIEANSYGVPVIVTKTGGMIELVNDGFNGYKVNPDDPEALASMIIYLLNNDEERIRLGQNGKTMVTDLYNWDKITSDLENIYQSA
ncbi:MAG: glycosyltransferase family 4 protein [Ignavibacteria bacterium]|nr:glycosyltransferase family 4 protein [Ignavibacteria bacterium]